MSGGLFYRVVLPLSVFAAIGIAAAAAFGLAAGLVAFIVPAGVLCLYIRGFAPNVVPSAAAEYESITDELKLALDTLRKLQPPIDLEIGGYRVTARSRQDREVGGDLFDAAVVDDTSFAVMVGDVSGKGLPAALVVPALLVLFRSELKRGGGPGELLERINRQLSDTMAHTGGATLGVGFVNTASGEIRYASAGQTDPYLLVPDHAPQPVDCSSLPLGIAPDARYEEKAIRLAQGGRLVLYTDGVLEASDPSGEMFGFDRLEAYLQRWSPEVAASHWMERLFTILDSGYSGRKDDKTLLVVERTAAPAVQPPARFERTWRLPSAPGCERRILPELAGLIRANWPQDHRTDDIVTCVAEAIMNAAEHGNRYEPDNAVTVHVHIGSMLMVCRIRDEGEGPRLPGLDGGERVVREEREDARGWGMVLIDGLADYWIANREENGFCLELFFVNHR